MSRPRRQRSDSFRGRGMHRQQHGACETVGDSQEEEEDNNSISSSDSQLSRKLSSADKRYKPTPTLKEMIRRRKSELGLTEEEIQRPPSLSELRRFEDFVDQLDNDPTQFAAYRRGLPEKEQTLLERTTIRIFCFYEAKDDQFAPLTPTEFQIKSTVDDLLVRMFICCPIDASAGPLPIPEVETVVSGGIAILSTEPAVVTRDSTPHPAKVVFSQSPQPAEFAFDD